MRPFRELPDWRIDDLMISFLYRAAASARISISTTCLSLGYRSSSLASGRKAANETALPHPDLLQVDPFEAIIDEELELAIFFIFRQDSRMKATRWKIDELFRGFSRAKYAGTD